MSEVGREPRTDAVSYSQPVTLAEVELAQPIPVLTRSADGHAAALVLVRLHGCPIGLVQMPFGDDGTISARSTADAVFDTLRGAVNEHLSHDGLDAVTEIPAQGVFAGSEPRCLRIFAEIRQRAPRVSVVVPTREAPNVLERCVQSILDTDYPAERMEIVIVDSAPVTSQTENLVSSRFGMEARVRYEHEPARGAANARNRGWRATESEIVVFADGDVVVDKSWLTALAAAFDDLSLGCVTGLVLPLELETPAQLLLEQFGGYAKGFRVRTFDLDEHRDADALYPYRAGAFGTGANMALRRSVLDAIGGFDPLLGPGTATLSGDDSELLLRVIVRGYRIGYAPSAIVRHPSERDYEDLRRQIYGYGVGLSAHLASLLLRHPSRVLDVVTKVPSALRFALSAESAKNQRRGVQYPRDLVPRRVDRNSVGFIRIRPELRAIPSRREVAAARRVMVVGVVDARGTVGRRRSGAGSGMITACRLLSAFGLLVVAVGDSAARESYAWAPWAFWCGVGLIVAPIGWGLAGADLMNSERLSLVVLLGCAMYFVKVLHSPTGFTFHDEFGQWRASDDVLTTRHLFTPNPPLLVAYPFYPALEICITCLVHLTGMSIYAASLVVIGLARVALVAALFQVFALLSGCGRVAGIAVAVYAANPNFLFFDSQAAYESLALPLACAALLLVFRMSMGRGRDRVAHGSGALLLGAALVVAHHLTTYLFVGLLMLWALVMAGMRRRGWELRELNSPLRVALPLLVASVVWSATVAVITYRYLFPVFSKAVGSVVDLLLGHGPGKRLFGAEAGRPQSLLAKSTGFSSVGLLLGAMPFGLVRLWRSHRGRALAVTLGILTVLYPATLALRFTRAGTETSNRASEFVYISVAFVAALALDSVIGAQRLRRLGRTGVTAFLLIILAGGIIIGWAPTARQPGPFLVGADVRSVSTQGLLASQWMRAHHGVDNRLAADRPNKLIFGSYGRQYPLSSNEGKTPYPAIFFSRTFTTFDRQVVARAKIRFLVVDMRLATGRPLVGVYFELEEQNANHHRQPIPGRSLTKFDNVPGLSRIFDSGAIHIFDTDRLIVGDLPRRNDTRVSRPGALR